MPKKNMTEEERKAWGKKMAESRAQKKTEKKAVPAQGVDPQVLAATVAAVLSEVNKHQRKSTGKVVNEGSMDKSDYADITGRLYDLPELARFAMRTNFIIKQGLQPVSWEGKDGLWHQQPSHVFKLFRLPTEEEVAESEEKGGALTKDTLIEENTHMQTDDEVASRTAAEKLGLKVGKDFSDFDELNDEMRFERVKKWLVDFLIRLPQKEAEGAPKELVVAGMVKKVHRLDGGQVMVESEKTL